MEKQMEDEMETGEGGIYKLQSTFPRQLMDMGSFQGPSLRTRLNYKRELYVHCYLEGQGDLVTSK